MRRSGLGEVAPRVLDLPVFPHLKMAMGASSVPRLSNVSYDVTGFDFLPDIDRVT